MKKNYIRIAVSILIIFALAFTTGIISQSILNMFGTREQRLRTGFEQKVAVRQQAIAADKEYFNSVFGVLERPQNFVSIILLSLGEAGINVSSEWNGLPLWIQQKDMESMLKEVLSATHEPFSWRDIVTREIRALEINAAELRIEDLAFEDGDSDCAKSAKLNIYFALAYYNSGKITGQLRDGYIEGRELFESVILGKNESGQDEYIGVNVSSINPQIMDILLNGGYVQAGAEVFDLASTYRITKNAMHEFGAEMFRLYAERITARYIQNLVRKNDFGDAAAAAELAEANAAGLERLSNKKILDENASTISRLLTRTGKNILAVMDEHYKAFTAVSDQKTLIESEEFLRHIKYDDLAIYLITALTMLLNVIALLYFVTRLIKGDKKLYLAQETFKAGSEYHKYISEHDMLTNLSNKEFLHQQFNRLIYGVEHMPKLALYFIDLDNFKEVNDVMGHNIGDILLEKAAQMLRMTCPDCEVVCRAGGDEFLVLKRYNEIEEVIRLGNRITEVFSKPIDLVNNCFSVTASVGAALYPDNGWDFQELYKNADTAMYTSKKQGRNMFTLYAPEMHKQILHNYNTLNYLRNFREHLYLEYQPIVWLDTGEIAGFEVLSRMKADDRYIPPSEFVPLAVENGLIIEMGYFTLREACKFIMRSRAEGVDVGIVTVNVSAAQLFDNLFIDRLKEIIRETKVDTRRLMFEFTEDVVINYKTSSKTIAQIRELGIQTGIDDFGTGYSSLSYFARLPFLFVKIAQDFVGHIGDLRSEKLLEIIIRLSDSFNMIACAEGIETEEHLIHLQKNKCMLGQGFLFSKSLGEKFVIKNVESIRNIIREIVCRDNTCEIYGELPQIEGFDGIVKRPCFRRIELPDVKTAD